MNPQGDVWLADLGLPAKTRPVVIVSRLATNPPSALTPFGNLGGDRRRSKRRDAQAVFRTRKALEGLGLFLARNGIG